MDARERAKLVEAHLEVAAKAARMVYKRVQGHVELDELVAIGNAALAEAAQRFDPAHGASFATFAWYRVQGAMFDACRKNTTLPRREWQKLQALRAAAAYLEHAGDRAAGALQQGAQPATGAVALAQIQQAMSAIRTTYLVSLEAREEAGVETPVPATDEAERIDRARLGRRLKLALAKLPEKERAMLAKHYFEDKNLLEAGQELGVSKSWASRLHAQAIDRLRALVDDG